MRHIFFFTFDTIDVLCLSSLTILANGLDISFVFEQNNGNVTVTWIECLNSPENGSKD